MRIPVDIKDHAYEVIVERGAVQKADRYLDLGRKVLLLTFVSSVKNAML